MHNKRNSQQVTNILVSWLDTIEKRQLNYQGQENLFIILSNDGYKEDSEQHILSLKQYNIEVLDFNNKQH
ncbi:DUF1829 domain-containing protein [Granulicatella sp. zg-84]|uniref:DUF1829 domain-containing protein n=1 Tax=Granulicatella sp. zg-84 TaxID=2678503 RepID=UPI0013C213C2|nr:DUF1829 domain-containing protein [Granulicatella sp. zg-84]